MKVDKVFQHDRMIIHMASAKHGHMKLYELVNPPEVPGLLRFLSGVPFKLSEVPRFEQIITEGMKSQFMKRIEDERLQGYLLFLTPQNMSHGLIKRPTMAWVVKHDIDLALGASGIHPENASDTELFDAILDFILTPKELAKLAG